jgi:hypothetical protein
MRNSTVIHKQEVVNKSVCIASKIRANMYRINCWWPAPPAPRRSRPFPTAHCWPRAGKGGGAQGAGRVVRPASVVASFSVIVLAHGWGFWHSGGEAKRAISNGPIRGLRTAPRTLLSSSKVEQGLANTGLRNGRADVMSNNTFEAFRLPPFIVTPEGRARPEGRAGTGHFPLYPTVWSKSELSALHIRHGGRRATRRGREEAQGKIQCLFEMFQTDLVKTRWRLSW